MTEQVQQLKKIIDESNNIVFFGGAGVSTESGIPDFRSVDGLYNQKYDYPPETILSHTFYRKKTAEFYRFYRDKMICLTAKPNAAHLKLAQWEKEGKLKAIVSITIDDEFVVHDIKVIEGEKGLFIAMPSKKALDGEYRDIAHPINSGTRDHIQTLILEKYKETADEVVE